MHSDSFYEIWIGKNCQFLFEDFYVNINIIRFVIFLQNISPNIAPVNWILVMTLFYAKPYNGEYRIFVKINYVLQRNCSVLNIHDEIMNLYGIVFQPMLSSLASAFWLSSAMKRVWQVNHPHPNRRPIILSSMEPLAVNTITASRPAHFF